MRGEHCAVLVDKPEGIGLVRGVVHQQVDDTVYVFVGEHNQLQGFRVDADGVGRELLPLDPELEAMFENAEAVTAPSGWKQREPDEAEQLDEKQPYGGYNFDDSSDVGYRPWDEHGRGEDNGNAY